MYSIIYSTHCWRSASIVCRCDVHMCINAGGKWCLRDGGEAAPTILGPDTPTINYECTCILEYIWFRYSRCAPWEHQRAHHHRARHHMHRGAREYIRIQVVVIKLYNIYLYIAYTLPPGVEIMVYIWRRHCMLEIFKQFVSSRKLFNKN